MLEYGPRWCRDYGNVFSASEAGERCHDESTGKFAGKVWAGGSAGEEPEVDSEKAIEPRG